ncbi:tyrosine-type recombinase/integrase [Bradyrhizobium lupini]
MNYVDRQMHRVAVELASKLPRLAEGESIDPPVWAVRPRKDGNYRAYKDGVYWGTTGRKTEAGANEWLRTMLLQQEADEDGVFDVRRVSVAVVIEARKKAVVKKGLLGAKVIVSTLKAIEEHVNKLQLRHLTDDKIGQVDTAMAAEGYSRDTIVNAVRFLRTAIRQYTKKEHGATYLPFDAPPSPKGRTTVVTDAQRDRVKRLAAAAFDPDSGLSDKQRRDFEVAYMELLLGMVFGSRPGAYHMLAWEEHGEGGWLDLDGATFHRVPPGAATPSNKAAPPVDIPEEILPELRLWKARAAGSPWVFRTLRGGPLSQREQQVIFKDVMAAFGLGRITGHMLRHTCISRMIRKRCTGPEISSVCGVSIETLYRRYGHFDRRAVQQLAHSAMADAMGEMQVAA